MGKKVLAKTSIKREKGLMYFCGNDKDGNITVNSVEMARGGTKKKKKKKSKK